ncbi:MAG: energy transducer TonB [Xanthomonadales bacterium]|nr:energy transducer TonB [Xanthomonadales bacterium]
MKLNVLVLLAAFGARAESVTDDERLLLTIHVSPPQVESALTYRAYVPPEYPREAWRRGLEGWVEVALSIGADGRVVDARVVASEPRGVFERAALRAVLQWQFEPSGQAVRNGVFRVDFKREES